MDGLRYIVSRLSIKLSRREQCLIDCDGSVHLADIRREHIIMLLIKLRSAIYRESIYIRLPELFLLPTVKGYKKRGKPDEGRKTGAKVKYRRYIFIRR